MTQKKTEQIPSAGRMTWQLSGPSDYYVHATDLPDQLRDDLLSIALPGRNDPAVAWFMSKYHVICHPDLARAFLKPWGAWSSDELDDHEENLRRLVWLASHDLKESGLIHFHTY